MFAPTKHRFTAAEYHRMAETGVLSPGARVELLNGEIIDMSPIGPFHGGIVARLTKLFNRTAEGRFHVSPQNPLRLDERSEPEPDLSVVRGQIADFRHSHPTTAELVIEICVSSHEYDRSKLRAYASMGVRECWLVLGPEQQIEVHRQPQAEQYAERAVYGPGGSVTSTAVPSFAVDMASLFAA